MHAHTSEPTSRPTPALPPSGARRISPEMLEARQRADGFAGVPAGTAKPFTYLAAFQEAVPYLGLPTQAFMLVSWLVKQTMPCDWETGSRPIAWPSARHQQEFLGLSAARVKALNRTLFEAGILVIRDNPQGKRYGRRGADKRIIEAYGFDLSPLAQRTDEFVRLAAAAKTERGRVKACRQRITIARRSVRQTGELLLGLGVPVPAELPQLVTEVAELVAIARRSERSDDLAAIAASIEGRQTRAEQWVKTLSQTVNPDPVGLVSEPHITSTTLNSDHSDTVIAAGGGSRGGQAAPSVPKIRPSPYRGVAGIRSTAQFIELFPQLEQYVAGPEPTWDDIAAAAGGALRADLGVSGSLWAEACQVLGREGAAVALAIVSAKPEGHFTKGPAGYFGGMIRKAQKGELYLEKTLWVLRAAKMGKPPSRALN